MSQSAASPRTWRFPRLILEDQLTLMLLTWAGLVVAVAAITLGFAWFGTVTGSVWAPAAGVAPWFVAFMAGYVLHTTLPLHVAHGRTRRDFAIEALVFGGIYAVVGALLLTLGYMLERALYAIGDWPLDIDGDHLFTSHTDLPLIFAEYLLRLAVWAAAGALVGAAIYRYGANGYVSLLPASLLISLSGGFTNGFMGFLARLVPALEVSSLPLAAVVSLACVAAAVAMTWPIVRTLPLRNR